MFVETSVCTAHISENNLLVVTRQRFSVIGKDFFP
ncbi:unnamed protein product [Nezara viridula]|uniref:Uncharacterized protein n=1 Tax=Nezara viridula TaxID=85310 RepID=A0A9P0HA98_NEZVI|nr:unnamed protein product [Nezara viridula]